MSLEETDFLPIILGGDINTYSLARAFHEEYGMKSVAVSLGRTHMISDSSFIDNIIIPDMDQEEGFVERLKGLACKHPGKKLVLLACGDWYVRMIVEHKAELARDFVIPYIDLDLLDRLVLKDVFYDICREIGVAIPETYVYDCSNPPDVLELPFGFPVVAKPASSAAYHYAEFPGKKKVFVLKTREELDEVLGNLASSSYKDKFLIQEFIPGDDTNMRILTCYCDEDSKVRFMAFGQTLLEEKTDFGIGNPAAIITRVNLDVMNEARRLLEAVGYTGFANFDIKYDPRDGGFKFFEINTRLGRSNYYVTGAGYNTVKWIVDDLVKGVDFGAELGPSGCVVADNEGMMYTVVPKDILMDYVKDTGLRAEIEECYRLGKVYNPVDCKAEAGFVRRVLYPRRFMSNQRKRFKSSGLS